jgi:DNA-binding XRE family transcriptional regulator
MKRKRTSKPIDVIEDLDLMVGDDAELRAVIEEETLYAEIASLVYRARTAAGLTQARLAKLAGTSQPAIARLEDADYGARSLAMLRRIAAALNRRLEIRLVPEKRRGRAA